MSEGTLPPSDQPGEQPGQPGDQPAASPPPPPPAAATPPQAPPPAPPVGAPSTAGGYQPAPPPPQPVGGPRPGQLGERFVARLIDGVIIGIVGYVINRVIVAAIFNPGTTTSFSSLAGATILYIIISSLISTALYLGYFGFMESSRGQTVGKMVMKLHVESVTGGNPTLQQALKRNIWLGATLLGVIPVLGSIVAALIELVAVIMIAVQIGNDPEARPWTDKYGDTRVLKEA